MYVIQSDLAPVETWRPGVTTRMLVSSRVGSQQLCLFEQWCAPLTGAPEHSHPVEEVLSVLQGTMQVWIGDLQALLSRGEAVVVPANTLHRFRNPGPDPLHLQAVLASNHFTAFPAAGGAAVERWSA